MCAAGHLTEWPGVRRNCNILLRYMGLTPCGVFAFGKQMPCADKDSPRRVFKSTGPGRPRRLRTERGVTLAPCPGENGRNRLTNLSLSRIVNSLREPAKKVVSRKNFGGLQEPLITALCGCRHKGDAILERYHNFPKRHHCLLRWGAGAGWLQPGDT